MKKYIITPLLLLVYLVLMAYFTYPGRNPELSYAQYYVTIGVTFVILVALSFFLKKKADNEKKWKEKEETHQNKD